MGRYVEDFIRILNKADKDCENKKVQTNTSKVRRAIFYSALSVYSNFCKNDIVFELSELRELEGSYVERGAEALKY